MDPKHLAVTVMAFLAPYFAKAGEEMAKKTGATLYSKIENWFKDRNDKKALSILKHLKEQPEQVKYGERLLMMLEMEIEDAPEFAKELQNLIPHDTSPQKTGDVITQTQTITGIVGQSVIQIGKQC